MNFTWACKRKIFFPPALILVQLFFLLLPLGKVHAARALPMMCICSATASSPPRCHEEFLFTAHQRSTLPFKPLHIYTMYWRLFLSIAFCIIIHHIHAIHSSLVIGTSLSSVINILTSHRVDIFPLASSTRWLRTVFHILMIISRGWEAPEDSNNEDNEDFESEKKEK